ncbi:MAG: fibro-slime domain-containing protein [Acutalibacteraceae bacterium]|nr:fibro-slime domain-containing protein [Acutalibacteraceae bacterium]
MKVKTFKRMSKRFISSLLSVIMVLSLFTVCMVGSTVTASAADITAGITIYFDTAGTTLGNNNSDVYLIIGKNDSEGASENYSVSYKMTKIGNTGVYKYDDFSSGWGGYTGFFFANGAGDVEGGQKTSLTTVSNKFTQNTSRTAIYKNNVSVDTKFTVSNSTNWELKTEKVETKVSTYSIDATLFNYRNTKQVANANASKTDDATKLAVDKSDGMATSVMTAKTYNEYNTAVGKWFESNESVLSSGEYFTPLYEGNFHEYAGDNQNSVDNNYNYYYNWVKVANAANRQYGKEPKNGSIQSAAQGLVSDTLSNMQDLKKGVPTQFGVELPQFSDTFTEENPKLQTKYSDLKFEVISTKDPITGNTWYSYNSETDGNRYLELNTDTTSGVKGTLKNGSSVYGCSNKDGGHNSIPGYYPFNPTNPDNKYDIVNSNGTRFDVTFTMPADGTGRINGEDLQFSFSGDDDLWVFIDGYLVLDLGGSHSKAEGSINLATRETTITTGVYNATYAKVTNKTDEKIAFNNATVITKFDAISTNPEINKALKASLNDTTKEHTMSIFYMERGQFDSNLKFSFMLPQSNALTIEQDINTTNVNSGLLEETLKTAENDVYSVKLESNSTSADSNTTAVIPIAKDFERTDASGKNKKTLQITAEETKSGTPFTNTTGKSVPANNTTFIWSDTNKSLDGTVSSTGVGTGKVDDNGRVNLLYNQSARFNDQFVTGSNITLTSLQEINSFDLSGGATKNQPGLTTNANINASSSEINREVDSYYDQKLSVVDSHGAKITPDANNMFAFANKDGSIQGVKFTATYTNTVKTTDIKITKTLAQGETDANALYPFTIEFKNVFGGSSEVWKSYPVSYTIGSNHLTYSAISKIKLKAGETAVITGVPVGTVYRITEGKATDTAKVYTIAQVDTTDSTKNAVIGNSLSLADNTYIATVGTDAGVKSTSNLNFINTSQTQKVVYRFRDRLVQTGMQTTYENHYTYFTGTVPGTIPNDVKNDDPSAEVYKNLIEKYAPKVENVLFKYSLDLENIDLNYTLTATDIDDEEGVTFSGLKEGDVVHLATYTEVEREYTVKYTSRRVKLDENGDVVEDEDGNVESEEKTDAVTKPYNRLTYDKLVDEEKDKITTLNTYTDADGVHNFRYWARATKDGGWTPISTNYEYTYRVSGDMTIKAIYDTDDEFSQLPGPEVNKDDEEDERDYYVTGTGSGYDASTLDATYDSYTVEKSTGPENRTRVNIMFGSVGSKDIDRKISHVGYILIKNPSTAGGYALDEKFSDDTLMSQLTNTSSPINGTIKDDNDNPYAVQVKSYEIQDYISVEVSKDVWVKYYEAGRVTLTNKNRMNLVFDIKNNESTQNPYYTCYTYMIRDGETYISDSPAYFSLKEAKPTVQDSAITKSYQVNESVIDNVDDTTDTNAGTVALSTTHISEGEAFEFTVTPTRFTEKGKTYISKLVSLQVGKVTITPSQDSNLKVTGGTYADKFTAEKYLNPGEETLEVIATFELEEDLTNIIVTLPSYDHGNVKVCATKTGTYTDSATISIDSGKFYLKATVTDSNYEFKGWSIDNGTTIASEANIYEVTVDTAGKYTMPIPVFAEKPVPTGTTLYLEVAHNDWKVGNERFAVYAYGSGDQWYDMENVSGNIYSVTIDPKYTSVIFCRMNGDTTDNSWDTFWNQSIDLPLEDGKNKYTLNTRGDKYSGTWSTYTP